MRSIRLFLLILLITPAIKASSQSVYLLPENFYLKKGEKVTLHLLQTDDFKKDNAVKFQSSKTGSFMLYEGSKKNDLIAQLKDTATNVSYELAGNGMVQAVLTLKSAGNDMSRNKFLRYIGDDDPDKIADKVKSSNQLYFKEKFTAYMKTLFYTDKPSGNNYEKPLNEDYEIVLKQNPYKFNYGDDIIALVNFKGKPIANAVVELYVKTVSGNVYPQKLSTDATGMVYFKLSREGIYFLTTKHSEPSKDKTADFETWRATYTFAFSSANDLPNTYREFGLGNKH